MLYICVCMCVSVTNKVSYGWIKNVKFNPYLNS